MMMNREDAEWKALKILRDNYITIVSDTDTEMALYYQDHIQVVIKELEEFQNRSCVQCKYNKIFYKGYLDDIETYSKCYHRKNPNVINLINSDDFCCSRFEVKDN